jgi:hypothetical protein
MTFFVRRISSIDSWRNSAIFLELKWEKDLWNDLRPTTDSRWSVFQYDTVLDISKIKEMSQKIPSRVEDELLEIIFNFLNSCQNNEDMDLTLIPWEKMDFCKLEKVDVAFPDVKHFELEKMTVSSMCKYSSKFKEFLADNNYIIF